MNVRPKTMWGVFVPDGDGAHWLDPETLEFRRDEAITSACFRLGYLVNGPTTWRKLYRAGVRVKKISVEPLNA